MEPYSRLDCLVAYEPGKLECIGYRDGKAVAFDEVQTKVPLKVYAHAEGLMAAVLSIPYHRSVF